MSNDIKSQPQPAPAGNVAQVFRPEASDVSASVAARPALNGVNVAQVFRPEAFAFPVPAAALELPTQIMSRLRKFAYPLLTKCKWSRPLLTGTDQQTEFDLTYSKQTTEKFLTGTRTHISDFRNLPNSSPVLSRKKLSKSLRRASAKHPPISRLLAAPIRPFLPNISALKTAFLPGSDQNVENDVTSRKQRTENFLPGATTTHCREPFHSKKKLPARTKSNSKRLGLRPLQHAQLPHRSQRPSRGRRHRPHRRLVVKLLGRKIGNHPRLNRRINFSDPRLQRPLALKIQNFFNLFKRHPIIPPVSIFNPHNFRPRHHAHNRRSQLLDLQIQRRRPHVKNLARNRARLRLQTRHHRSRRILHMQKWTPLLPIQNRNLPGGRRPRHK